MLCMCVCVLNSHRSSVDLSSNCPEKRRERCRFVVNSSLRGNLPSHSAARFHELFSLSLRSSTVSFFTPRGPRSLKRGVILFFFSFFFVCPHYTPLLLLLFSPAQHRREAVDGAAIRTRWWTWSPAVIFGECTSGTAG